MTATPAKSINRIACWDTPPPFGRGGEATVGGVYETEGTAGGETEPGFIDGPLIDGPLIDGPLIDGPLMEGPLKEGPLIDGAPIEGGAIGVPPENAPPPAEDGPPATGPAGVCRIIRVYSLGPEGRTTGPESDRLAGVLNSPVAPEETCPVPTADGGGGGGGALPEPTAPNIIVNSLLAGGGGALEGAGSANIMSNSSGWDACGTLPKEPPAGLRAGGAAGASNRGAANMRVNSPPCPGSGAGGAIGVAGPAGAFGARKS